jgi:hypothetical protein
MRLQQALGTAQVRSLIDAIAREQIDLALGGGIQESAVSLPARPHDGTLVDALLSEPVLSRIREEAAEQATAAVKRAKGAKHAQVCREMAAERARRRIKATRGATTVRMSSAARQCMEGRQAMIDGAPVPQPRDSLAILETLMPSRARTEPVVELDVEAPEAVEDRVHDPYTGRIVEAAVAAVPPAQRGWREQMALRGCGATTIEALGGAR